MSRMSPRVRERRPSNYTLEEKLEVVTSALIVGDTAAGLAGVSGRPVPRRTVSRWRNDPALLAALPERTLSPLALKLNRLVDKTIAQVEAKLDDPRNKLGELASTLRETLGGARLVAGEATRRSETNVHVDVRVQTDRIAAEMGLDPEEVYLEATRLLEGGTEAIIRQSAPFASIGGRDVARKLLQAEIDRRIDVTPPDPQAERHAAFREKVDAIAAERES